MKNKISFVIPCYGSELTIESVIEEIKEKVKEKKKYDYEIILSNDKSPDNVWNIIKKLASKDKKIKAINLAKNMYKHGAVMAGLAVAKGEYVVMLDDDGQCPVNDLWDLIKPLEDGHDAAHAKYPVKRQSKFKNFGSWLNKRMAEILINKPKDLYFNNFSAIQSYIVKEMIKYENPYPYVEGLLLRATDDIVNVTMDERERSIGDSNFTFKKMIKLWINGFTAFSVKPLRLASYVGFICSLIGVGYATYIITLKFLNPAVPQGYSSIMAVLLFIGGVIMLMLGIIGEYIGRIYISLNKSPQYVIREKINIEEDL